MANAFTVAFSAERAQYCVERADGMRIFPQVMPFSDPDAGKRARVLCETLNRMECEPTRAPARPTWHASVEGSPEDAPLDETQADVARKLREGSA